MSGYSRQSSADIVPTAVVRSAPVNAEFNALRDAFAFATGHRHDGSGTEGAYIPLIADTDGNNKFVVNTGQNRLEAYVEVSSAPAAQVYFQDGVIVPVVDNDIDLGTSVLEFKNLYLDGTAKIDTLTVDENATVAGSLSVTGLSTLPTVDINGGAIDGTTIGASSPNTAAFTTVNTSGQATLASANIDSGTIDGAVIGGTSAAAVTGTLITATTGFSGDLTGNVTGNVTGNITGNVTGNVTGNLTGNVTASSGTSTFQDLVVNGSLNMNAATTATIVNLTDPTNAQDAATKNYVDTSIANLVDSAPGTLDTLNELAAALGDDPNFSTTITTSIATKLSLAGGTMSGDIAMGTNSITGLADPVANQDAATKAYVDTQDATKLNLSGGTMTGSITMGANKVTSTATPTANDDLTRKAYVDSILGSATDAATSAAAAAVSESNAATSESNAALSASAAAASYDAFDDRYLGSKASAPSVDNDGDPLLSGAIYWDTTDSQLKVYDGSVWQNAVFNTAGAVVLSNWTITESGGSLYIATGGVNKMKLDASGNLQITGTIDTVATIS